MMVKNLSRAVVMIVVGAIAPAVLAQADHSHHRHDHGGGAGTTRLEVIAPERHQAGTSASTVVRLTSQDGKPLTPDDLKVAHTEKLHLLIVDKTLSDYHHKHPVPAGRPGEYRFDFAPRYGGTYHIWADIVPSATGKQEYARAEVTVTGPPATQNKTLNNIAEADGYRFRLTTEKSEPLEVGKAATVRVNVATADDTDFSELEPVMGAFAHMVGFPEKVDAVAHVHPTGKEPSTAEERGGPELEFQIVPERAGFHKFYLQTQIRGREVYASFGLDVQEGAEGTAAADAEYICPMCAGVKQSGPGKCPKCGMALVPADSEKKDEHRH